MGNYANKEIKDVLDLLEKGNLCAAKEILDSSMVHDLENNDIINLGKYCIFWIDSIEDCSKITDPYSKGEKLLTDWKRFLELLKNQEEIFTEAVYAIQRGIFSLALGFYTSLLDESDTKFKAEILRKLGLCHKKLGEYDNARERLAEANAILPSQAAVIAELADCYALCGDDKTAKVLFREAFFIESEKVDLAFLDSELICTLVTEIEKKGFNGELLNAWIPVYGVLWGVFNIKREMNAREIGKLKQDIFALEIKHKNPANDTVSLIPRLINMYFWLIDYCQMHNDRSLIDETLLKIKILDSTVYKLYIR